MRWPIRALFSAGALGLVAQLLFYGVPLGPNAALAAVLLLALAGGLRERRIARADAWIPVAAIVFAGLLALRTDPALVAVDTLAALGLCAGSVAAMSGAGLTTLPLSGAVREAGAALAATAYRAGPLIARERAQVTSLSTGYRRAAGSLAGIALALPFLAVFVLLFSSADAVFARLLGDVLDPRTWPAIITELPRRFELAAVVAWLAAGAFTLLVREPRAPAPAHRHGPLRVETATSLLVAVDLLFAFFVALQITYLFGGHDTLAAAGITYSAYARRGFFELVAAAFVVAGLLFGLDLLGGRKTRVLLGATLVLPLLTAVVLVSAAYRLDLYQRAYGWTELRFYALAAIVFLGLVLGTLGVASVAGRMDRALQPVVMAGLAVALVVNAVNPSAFVATADLDRIVHPADRQPDARIGPDLVYLALLGDGALPTVVERLPTLPERERFCLETLLRWRTRWRPMDATDPWQGWNLDRERARDALLAIRDELYAPFVGRREDHADRAAARIEARYREECAR